MSYFKVNLSKVNPLSASSLNILGECIGTVFVSRIDEAFEDGGYDSDKWAPSMKPNLGRIFNVINKKTVNASNQRLREAISDDQKTLVDTGLLRKSFTYNTRVESSGLKVQVGTNVDYAPKLHYGGPSMIQITPLAVTNIKKLIQNPDFDFLAKYIDKRNLMIRVQQRPLIVFDNTMKQYTIKAFELWRTKLAGEKRK